MKKIAFMFTFILVGLAGNGFAASELDLCNRMQNQFLGQDCRKIVLSGLFSQGAFALCAGLGSSNAFLANDCLKAIVNKKYNSDEVAACNTGNGFTQNQCLANSGTNVCR